MDPLTNRLWYNSPSKNGNEALPLGNGRLGGMIYGGVDSLRIGINEDTLFSGPDNSVSDYSLHEHLHEIRILLLQGSYKEAQRIIEEHPTGVRSASYLPLGELVIEPYWKDRDVCRAGNYYRELNLSEGICRESFSLGEKKYIREAFCSFPDQVLVWHYRGEKGNPVGLSCSLTSPLQHLCEKSETGGLLLRGTAPFSVTPPAEKDNDPVRYVPESGMEFCQVLHIQQEGGTSENYGNKIVIREACSITLILGAATGYCGMSRSPVPVNPSEETSRLLSVGKMTYDELKKRHTEDYKPLYKGVHWELEYSEKRDIPTDERLSSDKRGDNGKILSMLFFNYARYLLIASSRPGSQPANLQGIWNDSARPPWTGNLTTNINVEMNYWFAEPCGLSDCHKPLLAAIEEAALRGAVTAEKLYGCRGWCVHHGLDIWRQTEPSGGDAAWSFWPMAGPWLCQHLWDHYDYTGDREFLKQRAYPLMKGASLFCLDWMIEDKEGLLITSPSTSPENSFITTEGEKAAVSRGSTMDMSLIWQLFTHTMEASRILEKDKSFRDTLKNAQYRLYPLKIGKRGQLQEWSEDFQEADPGHRHTAHLYALHPGTRIDPAQQQKMADACRRTLDLRIEHEGEDTIGWCFAWYICFFARLGEGDRACKYLEKLLGGTFPNMLNAHRHRKISFYPMTIEANFGGAAGITELLLQSHRGIIDLLPSLPSLWPDGRISGLKARGGFTIDIKWSGGQLSEAVITSEQGNLCRLGSRDDLAVYTREGTAANISRRADHIAFDTVKEQTYRIQRRLI